MKFQGLNLTLISVEFWFCPGKMTILKLTLKEGEEATEHTSISFRDFIQSDESILRCGRFDPPIEEEGVMLSVFHFISFTFKNGIFSIFTGINSMPISAQSLPVINLTIIDPGKETVYFVCFLHLLHLVPVQQPEALSSRIRTLDQMCHAHVFHMNCDTRVVSFLSSFSCNWGKMGDAIKNSLKNSTFGAFGPAVCLADDERIDLTSFFSESKYMARSPVVLTVVSQSKCNLIQILFNCLFLYF
jgi:hypothetical protein